MVPLRITPEQFKKQLGELQRPALFTSFASYFIRVELWQEMRRLLASIERSHPGTA